MMQPFCRLVVLGAGLTIPIVSPGAVGAQQFPAGLIRLIVPSPAGTPPDIVGRILANEIAEAERWRLVTENKPGAIQTPGLVEVLKLPADGHTLASVALSASAAPALLQNVPFRLDRDFTSVIK